MFIQAFCIYTRVPSLEPRYATAPNILYSLFPLEGLRVKKFSLILLIKARPVSALMRYYSGAS